MTFTNSSQIVTLPDIPELHDPNFLDVLIPAREDVSFDTETMVLVADQAPKNSMMEALKATTHQTFTENSAPAYDSTLSPTLDAFMLLKGSGSQQEFDNRLQDAWTENPELTLRIIWNIRSIHDGTSNKKLFYRAFGWLYDHHPRTAISNLRWLVEPVCTTPKSKQALPHGYWKDLLNIITLATVDELHVQSPSFLHSERDKYQYNQRQPRKDGEDPVARVAASLAKDAENKRTAKAQRRRINAERYDNLKKKLSEPKFRALYIAVARLFSERLIKDLHSMDDLVALPATTSPGQRITLLRQLSLVGKWAPTPMGAHDRHTNIATAISLLLRQAQVPSQYPAVLNTPLDASESAAILRSFYQRWVLTPLRSTLCIPEPLMTSNRWSEIRYTRVSSVCMKTNMAHFYQHDSAGFQKYLASVENGRRKISGATLLPHELVGLARTLGPPADVEGTDNMSLKDFKQSLKATQIRVVEAQWKTMIEKLRESGSIDNAIAVCDVSGSMGYLPYVSHSKRKTKPEDVSPILPAISLSLVLAHLAVPPFNGGFVTFSERPQYVQLDLTKSLHETINTISTSDWGMNTNLNAVFLDLLLPLAISHNVPQDQMIKILFIFSDMQFDECSQESEDASDWKTNHDAIENAYKAAGYEMPKIVYWDLACRGTVEVLGDREGVALMNGFSPALLKVFMGEETEGSEWEKVDQDGGAKTVRVEEEFNPVSVMEKAVIKKSFDGLVVLD